MSNSPMLIMVWVLAEWLYHSIDAKTACNVIYLLSIALEHQCHQTIHLWPKNNAIKGQCTG
jgi:hypothetical protein